MGPYQIDIHPFSFHNVKDIFSFINVAVDKCNLGKSVSKSHKQDESASINEIVDCAKIAALIYMRKLKTSG